MKAAASLLFMIAACAPGGAGDDTYPVTPPGTGGGGTSVGGSTGSAGDDGGVSVIDAAPILGRVCILGPDMRDINPPQCGAQAGGLTVKLGSVNPATAITETDGTFAIERPVVADVWTVSGTVAGINAATIPSVMRFITTSTLIPMMLETDYNNLLGQHEIVLPEDRGAIVTHLVQAAGGTSVTGARATVDNGESQQTFYDGPNLNTWLTDSTGPAGMAWLPDNEAGSRMVTTTATGTSGTITKQFPVRIDAGAITFVTWTVK